MGREQPAQRRSVPELDADTWLTIFIDGEPLTIDQETTVADLKAMVDASPDDVLTWRDGDKLRQLTDRQVIADHLQDGTTASFMPSGKDNLFGSH